MRIISFIEDRDVIKTILNHLGLWFIRSKPPAKAHAPPTCEYVADGFCHAAFPDNAVYGDPDYSLSIILHPCKSKILSIININLSINREPPLPPRFIA